MNQAIELLKKTRIEVAPETYFLIGLTHADYRALLENPELSPRGDAPFMLLSDKREVTLLVDEIDWQAMKYAVQVGRSAKVEGDFRLLTFDIQLDWQVVGYFAKIAEIFAAAEIPIGAISAFSRDHLLIKQEYLARALLTLRDYVEDVC